MLTTRMLSNGSGALVERLRGRLSRAEDGVWITARDGQIVFWNSAAETILGFSAQDVVGRTCAEVFTRSDTRGRAVCGPICEATAGACNSVGSSFGMPMHAKDGRDVWLEVATFTTNGNESPPFVIHVFYDATRTQQLLRELREHIGHSPAPSIRLTRRELQVLRLMLEGLDTAASAKRLSVSRATVRNHVQNIFGKLGVHTRLEAVAQARRDRLV
jgi:PAS domain S-box-containing protein